MQNVNLYQRERRAQGGPRPRMILLGACALLVALLAHAAWQGWMLKQSALARQAAEAQALAAESELAAFRAAERLSTDNPDCTPNFGSRG